MGDDRTDEYTRVAYYYYKAKLTQEEIAGKMNMSRQRVNRILGKCEGLGIVRIEVSGCDELYLDMEAALEKKYRLSAVRIVGNEGPGHINTALGGAAGTYLAGIIEDGDVIGFSRGRATSALVDLMPAIDRKNLTVTQLVGGWSGGEANNDVDDIVNRFARRLGAEAVKLYAPVVVQNPEIRNSIMEEPFFKKAYATVRACTIAVAGIGNIESRAHLEYSAGGTGEEDFREYLRKGAVGEICTRFFTLEGGGVEGVLDHRTIAVTPEDFMKIPRRIGIAGGPEKRMAVEGAIRGGFINVLITDADTARGLMDGMEH